MGVLRKSEMSVGHNVCADPEMLRQRKRICNDAISHNSVRCSAAFNPRRLANTRVFCGLAFHLCNKKAIYAYYQP